MIEVKGLTKRYGTLEAVRDVSFRVDKGEIVGFLGPNGAGKSTTMRILTGFMPPSEGTATVDGHDVIEAPLEVKKRIGYLPESVPLYLEMTVRAFLNYAAEVKGVARAERAGAVDQAVERCGLKGMVTRPIGHLSKGYRQRTGLAQALIGNPPVLILDEPTVGLDPAQIIEIREMIRGLAGDHTILLSTHILPEVQMICDRAIIIHRGRVIAEDSLESLSGGSRLRVTVGGRRPDAMSAVEGLEGVDSVKEEGVASFWVDGEAVTGAAITQALVKADIPVESLERRQRTLEDVFVAAVAGETEGDR